MHGTDITTPTVAAVKTVVTQAVWGDAESAGTCAERCARASPHGPKRTWVVVVVDVVLAVRPVVPAVDVVMPGVIVREAVVTMARVGLVVAT